MFRSRHFNAHVFIFAYLTMVRDCKHEVGGFVLRTMVRQQHRNEPHWNWRLFVSDDTNIEGINSEELQLFKERKNVIERKVLRNQWRRPPNPILEPIEVISILLEELRSPTRPYAGVLSLLESATTSWRDLLRRSVGAPEDVTNEQLAPTLETALARPNNQFAILMNVEDLDYIPTFPSDTLDYGDGTSWIECRLRSRDDDELLVAMGWETNGRILGNICS